MSSTSDAGGADPVPGRFGHTELPPAQAAALRRARRLEFATLAFMASAITAVYFTMGSSQAMRTAWVEDLLALVPPLAFLVAARYGGRLPTADHPYGFHRATGIGHLTAAVALLGVGVSLVVDSGLGLIRGEHPPIGTTQLFGHTIWSGWLMILAMIYTGIGPLILGRLKLPLAEQLHDKVLYADADMQKADWTTAVATIVGVLGIGVGLWWADATAALVVASSIVRDGWRNLRYSTGALMDERARTFDDKAPHPLTVEVDRTLQSLDWISESRARIRDQGHVFHVEAFIRARPGEEASLDRLEEAVNRLRLLDWKINDVVLMPVRELPETIPPPRE